MAAKANMAVKMEPSLRKRLRALGAARRRSPHWLMGEAIRLYVEREEKVELARVESRERLALYDATGEFVEGEDVERWLESWGSKRERPAPTRRRRGTTR